MKPVRCPTCGNTLSVPDEASGKVAKCTCGELIRIPGEHVQAKPPVPGPPATLKRLPPKEGVARPVSPRPKRRNVLLLLVLPIASLSGMGLLLFGGLYFGILNAAPSDKALAKALDAWVFGDYGLQTKGGVSLFDDDKILIHSKLMRYEILSRSPVDKEKTDFSVILTFQSRGHTELKESKIYSVYQWNGKWKIAQRDPNMGEWLKIIKEDAKEGDDQEKGREAERELVSGRYRDKYDSGSLRAWKEFELGNTVLSGKSAALEKEFSLMEGKKKELQEYLLDEDDPGIRDTLTQMISSLEKVLSLKREPNRP